MKTTACIKLLALLLLAACDRTSKLSFEGGAPGGVHTIADLKARCTANSVAVTEDITLEGVVTGNDFYGEFYKTLVVEDASGGISVLIDGTRLAFDYPVAGRQQQERLRWAITAARSSLEPRPTAITA